MSKHTKLRWLFILLGLFLLLAFVPGWVQAAEPAKDELQTVWERVRQAGAYEFSADLTQTLTPLPTVKNAGRESKETRIYLEGETDLAAESLLMTLWSGGGSVSSPETGAQVKVEGGQAFTRQGSQPWEPVDDFTGMFAPGGDFMAYLVAADNIVRGDPERQSTPLGEIAFVRYTFDINGHRFATYMRDQITQQLNARGELPAGMSLELPKVYADMTGQGEVWVGADGLPIRQIFNLQFPETADDHTVSAQVSVDFSGFPPLPVTLSTRTHQALRRVVAGVATPQDALPWLTLLMALGFLALTVWQRRSKTLYAAVVLTVISSMLLTPLMRGAQVQAYTDRQQQRQAQQQAKQAQQDAQAQLQAQMLAPEFDPHTDPLASALAQQELAEALEAVTLTDAFTSTSTSNQYADSACEDNPNGDDDGDQLTNLEECLLGTLTGYTDTDQDGVDDYTEVNGFQTVDGSGSVVTWYTDPTVPDSNHDGISDGREWLLDANNDNKPDDTDGDGTPDMWDRDNDGDGVPDGLDLSPYTHTKDTNIFTDANPFQLILDDLTSDELVVASFQLRPTEADHLWYTYNVLDWSDNDKQGQIQDVDGKTFYDLDNDLVRSPNDNGDVRLIPMLEIEITGTSDNLPSDDVLKKYGVVVQQTTDNTQAAYVPLQLVTDATGDQYVAFQGRMVYDADSSWGNAQNVRLVWLVQALVDVCGYPADAPADYPPGAVWPPDPDQIPDGWTGDWPGDTWSLYKDSECQFWEKYNDLQVVQVYDDDWYLTGLHVKESHGVDMALIYEDPSAVSDGPLYMNALYQLQYGLDRSFLAGRDCDTTNSNGGCVGDGELDITVNEIYRRFNHTTNSTVSDEERWNIDNVLSVSTYTYDTMLLAAMDTTVTQTQTVLDDHFTAYWSSADPITPTIMYAWQEEYRAYNLDEGLRSSNHLSWSADRLAIDMPSGGDNPVNAETMVGYKWAPFVYDSATARWSHHDLDSFWDEMSGVLVGSFPDVEDADEAETLQYLAQLLYLSVSNGLQNLVKQAETTLTESFQVSDLSIGVKTGYGVVLGLSKAIKAAINIDQQWQYVIAGIEAAGGIATKARVLQYWVQIRMYQMFGGWKGVVGVVAGLVLVGVLIYLLATNHNLTNPPGGRQSSPSVKQIVLAAGVGVLMTALTVLRPLLTVYTVITKSIRAFAISTAEAVLRVMTCSTEVIGVVRSTAAIGLIVSITVVIGLFAYIWASGMVHAGTIAFNTLIAHTIAAIIVAVILFVVSLSVIGLIIVSIIATIDLVLTLLGLGSKSLTAQVTKAIASCLYEYDISTDQQLDISDIHLQLADESAGIVTGNSMIYSLEITTTLKQTAPDSAGESRTEEDVRQNSMAYALSEWTADQLAFSTSTGARHDDWDVTQYGTYESGPPGNKVTLPLYQGVVVDTVSVSIELEAGINKEIPFYLDAAYALVGQSCWVENCKPMTINGSSPTEVGSSIALDVLPATVTEFMDVTGWSDGGVRILDADGDGLLSYYEGGKDPDDTTWDTDGDGLSDAYELTLLERPYDEGGEHLDATLADTDGDGIRDDEELRQSTNPGNPDSDGDGLADVEEIRPSGGWLFSYAPDKQTRVWSNPLYADQDQDGMTDLFERTQDRCPECDPWQAPDYPQVFNPNVWNQNPVPLYVDDTSSDGYVAPLATFVYTTTTANNLSGQGSLVGDLDLTLPEGVTGGPLSAQVDVHPGESESLVSLLAAENTAQSINAMLTSSMNLTEFDQAAWAWDPYLETDSYPYAYDGQSYHHFYPNALASAAATGWSEPYLVATGGYTMTDLIPGHMLATIVVHTQDQNLTPVDPAEYVTLYSHDNASDDVSATAPDIACAQDGTCLVVWGTLVYGDQSGGKIRAARFHGGLSNPSIQTIWEADSDQGVSDVVVTSDGTDFMVAWMADQGAQVWAQPVNNDGSRSISAQQLLTGLAQNDGVVALARGFADYLIVWDAQGYLYRANLSASGELSDVTLIGEGRGVDSADPVRYYPLLPQRSLAYDPISQQALVAYYDGTMQFVARRLTAYGTSQPVVLAGQWNDTEKYYSVAADPVNGGWIVAWARTWGVYDPDISYYRNTYLQAVSPDGTLRGEPQSFSSDGVQQNCLGMSCSVPQPRLDLAFSEDAGATEFADSSGNGNNASCAPSGTCPLAGEGGRVGSGVFFDGVDDYLDTNAPVVELTKSDFSIGVWVKTTASHMAILTKSDGDTSWESGEKSFYLNEAGQPSFVGWGNNYIRSTRAVNDGLWHHLMVVWDYSGSGNGGVGRMYVDGVNVTDSSWVYYANVADSAGDTLKIGRPNFGEAPYYFEGYLDEVVVYDRALTAYEVGEIFEAAVAIYDLDEGAGSQTFIDAANNGFDATCSGSNCPELGVAGVAYTAAQFDGSDDYLTIDPTQKIDAIYNYDFESGAGSGWDHTNTDYATRAGGGTHFLGTFGNETANLNLSSLPLHDTVEVSFDLYVIGSWDGVRTDTGPDGWQWGAEGNQILNTTFSNGSDSDGNYQLYPAQSFDWQIVTLYQDYTSSYPYCSGIAESFTADDPDLGDNTIGDDTVSCIGTDADTVVILYKDSDYSGTSWLFDENRGIHAEFENDAVSSLRVWGAVHSPKHGSLGDSLSVSGYTDGAVYHISKTFSDHTAATFSLYFQGSGLTEDEVWGLDNVQVTLESEHTSIPLHDSSFTISAWAKREAPGSSEFLFSQGTISTNQGLQFGFLNSDTFTCAFWGDNVDTSAPDDMDWHHWACTYDSATGARWVYLDGESIGSDTAAGDYTGMGNTYIGRGLDGNYFNGAIDEMAIWTEALSADEIRVLYEKVKVDDQSVLSCLMQRPYSSIYRDTYQKLDALIMYETATGLGSESQTVSRTLGIDADSPLVSIEVPANNAYVSGEGVVNLSGSASDPTSYVQQVEVQIDGGEWLPAQGSETWSYNWDASSATEGVHSVSVRATDVVGHTGNPSTSQFIVDSQPPAVTVDIPGIDLRPGHNNRGRWRVTLSGTVSDPDAGGYPGSGVASLEILLAGVDEQEGDGWQPVTVAADGSWSVAYVLPVLNSLDLLEAGESGLFGIIMRATDNVGNTTPTDGGTFTSMLASTTYTVTVDTTGPAVTLSDPDPSTDLITQTLTLSGQVTDTNSIDTVEINFTPAEQIDALAGTILHLPFDETQDTQYFEDQSGANHPATCSTCPAANQTGQRDGAVSFDGSDIVTAEGIDLANKSLTLATWAKRGQIGEWSALMSQGTISTNQGLVFGYRSNNIFTCAFYGDDLDTPVAYSDTDWHHWACTYDASSGLRTLYRDGVQVAQDTATANYQGEGTLYLGGYLEGELLYNGLLDEVTVHDRALAAYEVANLYAYGSGTWETVSLSGDTNPTWSYTIPEGTEGLEGIYQINLRGVDALGNTTTQAGQRLWRGEIDTRPPVVSFSATELTTDLMGMKIIIGVRYDCTASDFNLDEGQFCTGVTYADLPGFQSSDMVLTTIDDVNPWYAATISDTTRLYEINAWRRTGLEPTNLTVQTCDAYGHCTTTSSLANAANVGASAATETMSVVDDTLDVAIITPSANAVFSSTAPIAVDGYAYALGALRTLTVTVNGEAEYIQNWATDNITGTLWSFEWTPPGQGVYQLQPIVRDWQHITPTFMVYLPLIFSNATYNNIQGTTPGIRPDIQVNTGTSAVYTGAVTTLYVDTEPPLIEIGPDALTMTHLIRGNIVRLEGTVSDFILHRVEVSVDGGSWQRASFDENGRWQIPLRLSGLFDGQSFDIRARATDKAGWSTTTSKTISVDIVPPAPVDIYLAYVNTNGQTLPTWAQATLTDAISLVMTWTPSNDGSGIAGYLVGWSQSPTPNPDELTLYDYTGVHSQVVGEAQAWYAHLQVVDGLGNVQSHTVGPLYVDGLYTPDFITDLRYLGWANEVCAIEGVDRRLAQTHPDVAGDAIQRFYTSWDAEALRVSWQGANWNHDGDLFLYLDTRAGGADRLFNPYPDDQNTILYLPGNTPDPLRADSAEYEGPSRAPETLSGNPVMGADLVVWVEDGHQATLYRWDGDAWQDEGALGEANFRFVSRSGGSSTDLLLPFSLMNISDPNTAALGLLAVATEEDALRIWSTMPTRNPVNSSKVVNSLAAQGATNTFALVREYFWNSLGNGLCPNGRLNADGSGPTGGSFADSDLVVTMSTDPVGTTYNFVNDDMAWLWSTLFGFENVPIVPSAVFTHLDTNHPPVAQGQTLTFVIDYANHGSETATGVQIELNPQYSLQVTEQVIDLGDLPPGATGSYTFTGQIDTAGLDPDLQQWAALEAFVYDDQSPRDLSGGSRSFAPLEWMWSDHEVDIAGPHEVGIIAPSDVIGDGPVTVRGYAYDESGVPLINLEVRHDGSTTQIQCPEATPENASWQCTWDPDSNLDGDTFEIRAQAVDQYGQASEWSEWVFLVVDTTPPAVTVDSGVDGQTFGSGPHSLHGSIADNVAVAAVRVCQPDEDCTTQAVLPDSSGEPLQPEGNWSINLPAPGVPDVDGLEQTLLVYGVDSVGNISTDPVTVTYRLDFTTPNLSVTEVVEQITPLSPNPVISGTVSDGSTFDVYVRVTPPSGVEYLAKASVVGETWSYTPYWSVTGEYTLWVSAEDAAGNRRIIGSYLVTVVP